MGNSLNKLIKGYRLFSATYALQYDDILKNLTAGQTPEIMVIGCSDSRVDPALMLNCDPGDLFVTRNVANVVPPFADDKMIHGTSAAIEYGVRHLEVKHLIILGHSGCGGINARLNPSCVEDSDFLSNWTGLIDVNDKAPDLNECAKHSLLNSHKNCLSFPWIKEKVDAGDMQIHLWFFDITDASIHAYNFDEKEYQPL